MPFYCIKDVLGNITEIVDSNGIVVVSYNYDAWGNVVSKFFFKYGVANAKTNYSITLGTTVYTAQDIDNLNSHYYRGYYYDKETGFYYLTTRYYDPKTGRFISPDDPKYLNFEVAYGHNRYAYCCNNPVMYIDPEGCMALSIGILMVIGFGVGAVIGAGASVAGQYLANGYSFENFSWGQLALDTVLGGASGLLSMSPLGLGAMVVANAGLGFVGAVGGHLINGSDFSKYSTWLDIGLSTGLGALVGLVGGPGALNASYLNGAQQTAGFIRAAGLYDDVLTKVVTGGYRTAGIASNALRLSRQNFVKQWNKMIVGQAGRALTKALAYGGAVLFTGTVGKGLLYDWYNNYF